MEANDLIENAKYKIGQKVMVEADRPYCSGGPSKIDDIVIRYSDKTGEPFITYQIDGKLWDENGGCISHPEFMYSINYNYYTIIDSNYENQTEPNENITIGSIKIPTMNLRQQKRWTGREYQLFLQQMFIDNLGNHEWIDVPIIESL